MFEFLSESKSKKLELAVFGHLIGCDKIRDHYFNEYIQDKTEEIFDLLWIIYYDFYAINNPIYQIYIDNKYLKQELIKTKLQNHSF